MESCLDVCEADDDTCDDACSQLAAIDFTNLPDAQQDMPEPPPTAADGLATNDTQESSFYEYVLTCGYLEIFVAHAGCGGFDAAQTCEDGNSTGIAYHSGMRVYVILDCATASLIGVGNH